jgi:hypothetical protein
MSISLRDAYLASQPLEEMELQRRATERASLEDMGLMGRGLAQGMHQVGANLGNMAGQLAEPVAPGLARGLYGWADEQGQAGRGYMLPEDVQSWEDVRGPGDFLNMMGGAAARNIPNMAITVPVGAAATLATRGSALPVVGRAWLGATAASAPLQLGEMAGSMREDPEIMASTTPGERLRNAAAYAALTAPLEGAADALLLGRVGGAAVGSPVKNIFKDGVKNTLKSAAGHVAKAVPEAALTEGAPEALQTGIQQRMLSNLNPKRDTSRDNMELLDSFLQGWGAGAAPSVVGRTADVGWAQARGARDAAVSLLTPKRLPPSLADADDPTVVAWDDQDNQQRNATAQAAADDILSDPVASDSLKQGARAFYERFRQGAGTAWESLAQVMKGEERLRGAREGIDSFLREAKGRIDKGLRAARKANAEVFGSATEDGGTGKASMQSDLDQEIFHRFTRDFDPNGAAAGDDGLAGRLYDTVKSALREDNWDELPWHRLEDEFGGPEQMAETIIRLRENLVRAGEVEDDPSFAEQLIAVAQRGATSERAAMDVVKRYALEYIGRKPSSAELRETTNQIRSLLAQRESLPAAERAAFEQGLRAAFGENVEKVVRALAPSRSEGQAYETEAEGVDDLTGERFQTQAGEEFTPGTRFVGSAVQSARRARAEGGADNALTEHGGFWNLGHPKPLVRAGIREKFNAKAAELRKAGHHVRELAPLEYAREAGVPLEDIAGNLNVSVEALEDHPARMLAVDERDMEKDALSLDGDDLANLAENTARALKNLPTSIPIRDEGRRKAIAEALGRRDVGEQRRAMRNLGLEHGVRLRDTARGLFLDNNPKHGGNGIFTVHMDDGASHAISAPQLIRLMRERGRGQFQTGSPLEAFSAGISALMNLPGFERISVGNLWGQERQVTRQRLTAQGGSKAGRTFSRNDPLGVFGPSFLLEPGITLGRARNAQDARWARFDKESRRYTAPAAEPSELDLTANILEVVKRRLGEGASIEELSEEALAEVQKEHDKLVRQIAWLEKILPQLEQQASPLREVLSKLDQKIAAATEEESSELEKQRADVKRELDWMEERLANGKGELTQLKNTDLMEEWRSAWVSEREALKEALEDKIRELQEIEDQYTGEGERAAMVGEDYRLPTNRDVTPTEHRQEKVQDFNDDGTPKHPPGKPRESGGGNLSDSAGTTFNGVVLHLRPGVSGRHFTLPARQVVAVIREMRQVVGASPTLARAERLVAHSAAMQKAGNVAARNAAIAAAGGTLVNGAADAMMKIQTQGEAATEAVERNALRAKWRALRDLAARLQDKALDYNENRKAHDALLPPELRPGRLPVSTARTEAATGDAPAPAAQGARVQLPRTSPYWAKDQAKSDRANKFIGRGSPRSSTAVYAQAWGERANSGEYAAGDTVFVSVEGNRSGRLSPDWRELRKAADAGVTFITDDAVNRARPYNVGERDVAAWLERNGYSENESGVWTNGKYSKAMGKRRREQEEKKHEREERLREKEEQEQRAREERLRKREEKKREQGTQASATLEQGAQATSTDNISEAAQEAEAKIEQELSKVEEAIGEALGPMPDGEEAASRAAEEFIRQAGEQARSAEKSSEQATGAASRNELRRRWLRLRAALRRALKALKQAYNNRDWRNNSLVKALRDASKALMDFAKELGASGVEVATDAAQRVNKWAHVFIREYRQDGAREGKASMRFPGEHGKTRNDFVLPELPEYANSRTGDLAYLNDIPIRMEVGTARGAHQGFGLTHIAEESAQLQSRSVPKTTDDRAENILREVLAVLKGSTTIYKEDALLRVVGRKQNVILKPVMHRGEVDYYRIVTLRPAKKVMEGQLFKSGRLTFPDSDTVSASAPEANAAERLSPPDGETDTTGRKGLGEKFDINNPDGISQASVTIKRKRKLENFSNQNAVNDGQASLQNAEEWASAKRDELKEYIEKVLGPKVKVVWAKSLGGASGYWKRVGETGEAIIRIAIGASDPKGTMYHEAMHEFYQRLKESGSELTEVLERAANSPIVRRQLKKFFGDDVNFAAIKKQLDEDVSERIAYMHQLYIAGKINLGPRTKSALRKVIDFFLEIFGLARDLPPAEAIMGYFHQGKLNDMDAVSRVLFKDPRRRRRVADEGSRLLKPMARALREVFYTSQNILSESKNSGFEQIGRLFSTETGQEHQGISFMDAKVMKTNQMLGRLWNILREHPQEAVDSALEALQRGEAATDPVALGIQHGVRKMLDDIYKYMQERGVKVGKVENYFPRKWDSAVIAESREEFTTMLMAEHERVAGEPLARKVAEGITDALIDNQGNEPVSEIELVNGYSPFMAASNQRVLDFIQDPEFARFQEKDLVGILSNYIAQAVHKAEYTQRFGRNGDKLRGMVLDAIGEEVGEESWAAARKRAQDFLDKRMAEWKKEGMKAGEIAERLAASGYRYGQLTPYHVLNFLNDQVARDKFTAFEPRLRQNTRAIMAMEGTLGANISPSLRKLNAGVMVYENMRLLGLSLFSQVIDPFGVIVRGGTVEQAWDAFKRGAKGAWAGWLGQAGNDEATRLATRLGVIDMGNYLNTQSSAYTSLYLGKTARKWNDRLFRWNGVEGFSQGTRVAAMLAAIDFIKRHATRPDKHSERWLAELKLKPGDVKLAGGELDYTNPKIQQAIFRWVEGAILRPNAAMRPPWASDPHWALVFHLKQFTYAMQKVLLERVVNELRHGNHDPALAMLFGSVPAIIAADFLRGLVMNGGEEPPWKKDWGFFDYLSNGVQRAGLLGVPQITLDAAHWGVAELSGPAVSQVYRLASTYSTASRQDAALDREAASHPTPGNVERAEKFSALGHTVRRGLRDALPVQVRAMVNAVG